MTKQLNPPTYTVSVWDHESGLWEPRRKRVDARGAIRAVRALECEGWDRQVSILVERNYTKAERAARDQRLEEMFANAKWEHYWFPGQEPELHVGEHI